MKDLHYCIKSLFSPLHLSCGLWKRLFFLFLITGSVSTGCETIPKAPSPLAASVSKIDHVLRYIGEAYENKDETRLLLYFDSSFPDLPLLKERVGGDFKVFSEIKMNMKISRVDVTHEAILTGVYWEGVWKTETKEEPLLQSGYALYRFSKDDPPRILEIRGDVPWGMASPLGQF